MSPGQEIIYVADLAVILGKTYPAVVAMHHRGQLPQSFYIGRRVAWRRATIDEWISELAKTANNLVTENKRAGRKRMGYDVDVIGARQT